MTITLALLHAPSSLPELQRLIAHASVLRDPKFEERFRRSHGNTGLRMSLTHHKIKLPAPASGG